MQIVQKKLFSPTQEIRLTDDDFIAITLKRILSERSFRFDLRDFDPEPSRQKSIPRNAVALAIVFGLLTLTGLIPALTERDPEQRGPYILSAIFWGALLFASILYAWFMRTDIHAYFHRYSGKALITLYHGKPTQAAFDSFTTALNARLKAINSRSVPTKEPELPESEHPFSLN